MRKSALAAVLAIVALLGAWTPVAAAALPSTAKVVIIVGATHGATSAYRSAANEVYAEAIKYTPNVFKVYSPNATWAAVKSATTGANIVIYLGHGNGWPSPYTYDPAYTTKNGFGLNATAGAGDHNNKYYGEPSIRTLSFAPNAIVMLNRLCYASGNSEPGHATPTLKTAKQRVDNYASAFLRAGAKAVIAEGHGSLVPYVRGLFTTNQSIHSIWRAAPNYHGNEFSFASSRTPGATVAMDPEGVNGYYRSIVGRWTPTGVVILPSRGATDTTGLASPRSHGVITTRLAR